MILREVIHKGCDNLLKVVIIPMKLISELFERFSSSSEFMFIFAIVVNQIFIHCSGLVFVVATLVNGIVTH